MVGTAANYPIERTIDHLAVSMHCFVLSSIDEDRIHVKEKIYSL